MPKRLSNRQVLDRATKESEFMAQIIELAHLKGWVVAHFRPARTTRKDARGNPIWVTPVQADGAGWPDLFLVRPHEGRFTECVVIECKAQGKKLSPEQEHWLYLLNNVQGVHARCFQPSHWDEIERVLA